MTDIEKRPDAATIEVAREPDTAIRAVARQMHLSWEALVALVDAAKEQNIHEAVGFPSRTAYLADALDGQWKVERDKRGEAVRRRRQKDHPRDGSRRGAPRLDPPRHRIATRLVRNREECARNGSPLRDRRNCTHRG